MLSGDHMVGNEKDWKGKPVILAPDFNVEGNDLSSRSRKAKNGPNSDYRPVLSQ